MTNTENEDIQSQLKDMRQYMRTRIKSGYVRADQFPQMLDEAIEYAEFEGSDSQAQEVLDALIIELRKEQGVVPSTTDNDRLTQAFEALESSGIMARENYTCCQTCGSAELWDEVELAMMDGRQVQGYAFFHEQDTERGVDGGGVYLSYAATADGDEAGEDVGRKIVAALKKAGLNPSWSETITERIHVPMVWNRRIDLPDSGGKIKNRQSP